LRLVAGFKNTVAFLTIIPVGMDQDALAQASNYMPLFPVVGGAIGFIAGISIWVIGTFLPSQVVGFLGVGILLLFTGAHHTDGLLDLGDALMSHGSRDDKIRILHDLQLGTGGLVCGLVVLGTTAVAIASLNRNVVLQSIIASETAAKFSMVFLAAFGKSAHRGLNTYFVEAMHRNFRSARLLTACALLLAIVLLSLRIVGFSVAAASVLTAGLLLGISVHQFGGITGDTMGACNDLTRMISLLAILVFQGWL
jgi:adenosylcobinamide-GDP ribazoletransferase